MKALVFSDNQDIIAQILSALKGKADADAAALSPVMEGVDQYGATRLYELTGNPGCQKKQVPSSYGLLYCL